MKNVALDELLNTVGRPLDDGDQVEITGKDPVLPTCFPLGELGAGVHAACGLAVADLWEHRTGRRQSVKIDMQAAAASLQSFYYLRHEGPKLDLSTSITRFYEAKNGRWFFAHFGFPKLRDGLLDLLKCEDTIEAVAKSISQWEALDLEDAVAKAGLCGAMVRSQEEWLAHPQGQTLQNIPVIEIQKIGDSPPESLGEGDRPLSGVRVLDLTRVLAGPTCARTLAEHGADILKIGASHIPSFTPFVIDTGHGKRSTFLDLRKKSDSEILDNLVRGADILSQSYRPGKINGFRFSPREVAEKRPGIIYVSTNCYGHEGPWKDRPGWEQLAQTVSGIASEEGGAESPRLLPAAATDYTTGYLGAYGALVALGRRAREGGSYLVRVSLTQSAMMINRLNRVPREDAEKQSPIALSESQIQTLILKADSGFGNIQFLGPVLSLSETPPRWDQPAVPLGTNAPEWL